MKFRRLSACVIFVLAALMAFSAAGCAPRKDSPSQVTVSPVLSENTQAEQPKTTQTPAVSAAASVVLPEAVTTSEPTPEPTQSMLVFANELNIRSAPSQQSEIIGSLYFGDIVEAGSLVDGFYSLRTDSGDQGYCSADYLCPPETELMAVVPEGTDEEGRVNKLTDVRQAIPDIDTYMIFATDVNFTGEVLYPRDLCLLQSDTAEHLAEANALFRADGYTIRIYDAYRPLSVQRILFDIIGDASYIANPDANGSNHNRGAAVDITLLDSFGNEVDMPTPMHTLNSDANRDNPEWTAQQAQNVDYMTGIMTSCGFNTINSEWWHFADKRQSGYMTTDLDFNTVTMKPAFP